MSEIENDHFDLSPPVGSEPLSFNDARNAISTALPTVDVDHHAALDEAQRRFEALAGDPHNSGMRFTDE